MRPISASAALAELLALLRRSFPQYLRYARPYIPPGETSIELTFEEIVADQDLLAARVEEQLEARDCQLSTAEFPMEFTDAHDLSIDYLLQRTISYVEQDILKLSQLSESLATNQSVRLLVDEAKGMARGHLESLKECQ